MEGAAGLECYCLSGDASVARLSWMALWPCCSNWTGRWGCAPGRTDRFGKPPGAVLFTVRVKGAVFFARNAVRAEKSRIGIECRGNEINDRKTRTLAKGARMRHPKNSKSKPWPPAISKDGAPGCTSSKPLKGWPPGNPLTRAQPFTEGRTGRPRIQNQRPGHSPCSIRIQTIAGISTVVAVCWMPMTISQRLIPEWVEDWFVRGILIRRLQPQDIQDGNDLRKAFEALAASLLVVGIIEFFVITLYRPRDSFGQILGVPAYAIVQAVSIGVFVLLLLFFLFILNVKVAAFRTAAMTLYALSGALPFLMLLSVEILNEAISLMIQYRDPSNLYMTAAMQSLLAPEHTASYLTARVLVEIAGIIACFFYYIFVQLRRLLILSVKGPAPRYRITLALLLTVVCQTFIVNYLLGRIYWIIIAKVIGS